MGSKSEAPCFRGFVITVGKTGHVGHHPLLGPLPRKSGAATPLTLEQQIKALQVQLQEANENGLPWPPDGGRMVSHRCQPTAGRFRVPSRNKGLTIPP